MRPIASLEHQIKSPERSGATEEQGSAWLGEARPGGAWLGKEHGLAGPGGAGRGKARNKGRKAK